MNLIGRKFEISVLLDAYKSKRSELIAVYGRRRVGKTFLIRNVYKNNILFELSGICKGSLQIQLDNFHYQLSSKKKGLKKPNTWFEAFHQLDNYINSRSLSTKKVLFFDEFPWLDTRKSNFLPAFDNFWNSYASKRNDLVVVICGSAASYMIQNIIKSKGGLHNRLTRQIHLLPFNLFETELLLKSNRIKLSRYDILQLYMAMGGIPHYLENILPGESVAKAIDRLCFSKDGLLRIEFNNVFASLFDQYENHETIIRTLASVRKGLTRNEILAKNKFSSGGTLTKTLVELEESGFIEKYIPYHKKNKDSIYRLTDEYSLFYIKFIEKTKPSRGTVWLKIFLKPSYKIWSGFSFETICIKHVEQIKEALKISGVNTTQSSWIGKNKQNGAQIDLLIDRDDNVITVCEIKFSNSVFTIDKKYASELERKLKAFSAATKCRKNLFVAFITSFGLNSNKYSIQHVQNELTMDHLFTEL